LNSSELRGKDPEKIRRRIQEGFYLSERVMEVVVRKILKEFEDEKLFS